MTILRSTLAKRAGIGAETIRFYEQKGLLRKPKRNPNGFRIYEEADVERLLFIQRCQELGFSLLEIKELLQLTTNIRTPRKKVKDFAEARLTIIRRKIKDLKAMERSLSGLVAQCDGVGELEGCPIADFLSSPEKTTNRRLS